MLELLYLSGMKQQKYSSRALFELARKATSFAPEDSAPSSPTQRVRKLHFFFFLSRSIKLLVICVCGLDLLLIVMLKVFLGEEFVNNPTLSDVTFLIDGITINLIFVSLNSTCGL